MAGEGLFVPNRNGTATADRIDADGDCWEWTGEDNGNGYGKTNFDGDFVYVHRLIWEHLVGPIPDGYELDHLCRNPICCNPDHLEVVEHAENSRRGQAGWHNKRKTHCPKGHPLSGDNLYVAPGSNRRRCRQCRREQNAERYWSQKGAE